jgi:hypothetical protein
MKAAYLWLVHDFLGYGDFSRWSTHGKLACPYGYGCEGFQLRHGHKPFWFDYHRCFLPQNHPFRNQANAFCKNTKVLEEAPGCLSWEEVQAHVQKFVADTENFGKLHNYTFLSCFRQLPYFSKLKLPHNIDLMHNEKNVAEHLEHIL